MKYTLTFISSSLIMYLVIAFINLELNIFEMTWVMRYWIVCTGIMATSMHVIINHSDKLP